MGILRHIFPRINEGLHEGAYLHEGAFEAVDTKPTVLPDSTVIAILLIAIRSFGSYASNVPCAPHIRLMWGYYVVMHVNVRYSCLCRPSP